MAVRTGQIEGGDFNYNIHISASLSRRLLIIEILYFYLIMKIVVPE